MVNYKNCPSTQSGLVSGKVLPVSALTEFLLVSALIKGVSSTVVDSQFVGFNSEFGWLERKVQFERHTAFPKCQRFID
jgi:hypothetical protein